MGYLQGAYLIAAVGLVAYVYRSSLKALVQKGNPLLLLSRPVALLALAFIAGLNVRSIGESFAAFLPPSIAEPFFYLVTLIAIWGVSLLPFFRPVQTDSQKPM